MTIIKIPIQYFNQFYGQVWNFTSQLKLPEDINTITNIMFRFHTQTIFTACFRLNGQICLKMKRRRGQEDPWTKLWETS